MKKIATIILIFVFSFHLSCTIQKETKLSKIWETEAIFWGPESVVYDQKNECLYVSNFNDKGGFTKSDRSLHNECISKVDLNGNVIEFKWVDGLQGCTGITIYKNHVYVVDRTALNKINIETKSIENRFLFSDPGFPNDIAVDDNGTFYISDGQKKAIYRIKNGVMETWIQSEELAAINGILYDEGKLIVGTNEDNYLKSIDITSKAINKIVFLGEGAIDGIKKYGKDYLVSHYAGNLYQISNDGNVKELLNTREQGQKCADFEYIKAKNMLIIPTLQNNNMKAYLIK